MIIRAVHNRNNPYFQIRRDTAQDKELPARALGLLIYLMSKPDTWEPTIEDICNRFPDVGQKQAYRIINETLIPLGYARRVAERDGGQFVRWVTEIYETPVGQNNQLDSSPDGSFDCPPVGQNSQLVPPDGHYQMAKMATIDINRVQNTDNKELSINTENTERVSPSVQDIFAYWQSRMNHPTAKLTPKRKKLIQARLKDYTLIEIKKAIDGCASSPFHMGQNETGTVYDDIELICRNGEKLESFISRSNGNGQTRVPRNETHNERCAREMDELLRRSLAASNGDSGADTADADAPWLTADFTRL